MKKKRIRKTDRLRCKLEAKDFQIRALLAGRDMRDEEIRKLANMANNATRILTKLIEEKGGEVTYSMEELAAVDPRKAKAYPSEDGKIIKIKIGGE